MPTIGWIDALRTYNAGMPSWCVPRKGTPGHDMVMKIRRGEQVESKEDVKVPTMKTDRPPTKSSDTTHKTMAVIPTTYVAEGGSKTREQLVAEFEKVTTERATLRRDGKTRTKAYKELDQRRSRIGVQLGGIYAVSGPSKIRVSVAEREAKEAPKEEPKEEAPRKLKFKPEVAAIIKKLMKVDEKIDQLKEAHKTQDKSIPAKDAELKPLEAEHRALRNQQKDEMAKDVQVYEPPKGTERFRILGGDNKYRSYGRLRIRGKTIEVSKKSQPAVEDWIDITNLIKSTIEITDAEVRIDDADVLHRVKKPRFDDVYVSGMRM